MLTTNFSYSKKRRKKNNVTTEQNLPRSSLVIQLNSLSNENYPENCYLQETWYSREDKMFSS